MCVPGHPCRVFLTRKINPRDSKLFPKYILHYRSNVEISFHPLSVHSLGSLRRCCKGLCCRSLKCPGLGHSFPLSKFSNLITLVYGSKQQVFIVTSSNHPLNFSHSGVHSSRQFTNYGIKSSTTYGHTPSLTPLSILLQFFLSRRLIYNPHFGLQ